MSLAARVVRRFLAEAIADPKKELPKFLVICADFSKHEKFVEQDLPKLRRMVELFGGVDRSDNQIEPQSPEERAFKEELKKTKKERDDVDAEVRRGFWFKFGKSTAQRLFWSILQQYRVPPNVQKAIENASKFWSKSTVRMPSLPDKRPYSGSYSNSLIFEETYLKILSVLKDQCANAIAAIHKGEAHADPAVAAKTKTHVGPFDVVNTGNFDDDTMKRMAEIVEKAEKALTGHGLGKICYGDILISKAIDRKKGVAAFYLPSSDEMFIRADAPDSWDTVQVVCHELSHRLENKFLHQKRFDINSLYRKITEGHKGTGAPPLPKVGDLVPYKGKILKVTGYGDRTSIKLMDTADPTKALRAPQETVARLMGWKPEKTDMSFITDYAKSGGAGENFAEMVSYYVLDKLPKPQVELLEPVLFA